MIVILSRLLHLFIFGVLIFRFNKYKFQKFNKENAGLVFFSGILLAVFEREHIWFYPLLGLEIILLSYYIIRLIKHKQ